MTEYSQKRARQRLDLRLPVRIFCKETSDFQWEAITHLNNVTPFGCGFTLKRPTERGRLLYMTIPLPRQLRVFDHAADQYKVWSIVRYLRPLVPPDKETPLFEIGVAFIGKHAPKSYEEDPSRRYDVEGSFAETLTISDPSQNADADPMSRLRHKVSVDLLLETLDEKGEVSVSEPAVTESLGPRGATILTSLDVSVGRFIRIRSRQYDLTIHAAVRSRGKKDGVAKMDVEFVDQEWPL